MRSICKCLYCRYFLNSMTGLHKWKYPVMKAWYGLGWWFYDRDLLRCSPVEGEELCTWWIFHNWYKHIK